MGVFQAPEKRQYQPNAPVVGTPENGERSDLRLARFLFVSPCKRFDCVGEVSDGCNHTLPLTAP